MKRQVKLTEACEIIIRDIKMSLMNMYRAENMTEVVRYITSDKVTPWTAKKKTVQIRAYECLGSALTVRKMLKMLDISNNRVYEVGDRKMTIKDLLQISDDALEECDVLCNMSFNHIAKYTDAGIESRRDEIKNLKPYVNAVERELNNLMDALEIAITAVYGGKPNDTST